MPTRSSRSEEHVELEQAAARGAIERVVDPGAAPLRRHQAGLAEDLEVVRDRRLGQLEMTLDVAHAKLRAGREEPYHLEARLIPEGLEELGVGLRRLGSHLRPR